MPVNFEKNNNNRGKDFSLNTLDFLRG